MGSTTERGRLPRTLERLDLAAQTIVLFPMNAMVRPWVEAAAAAAAPPAAAAAAPPLAHLVLDAQWVHTHDWAVLADAAPDLITIRAASEIWIRNYLRSRAETLEQVRV